jgi:hypothetical protein
MCFDSMVMLHRERLSVPRQRTLRGLTWSTYFLQHINICSHQVARLNSFGSISSLSFVSPFKAIGRERMSWGTCDSPPRLKLMCLPAGGARRAVGRARARQAVGDHRLLAALHGCYRGCLPSRPSSSPVALA